MSLSLLPLYSVYYGYILMLIFVLREWRLDLNFFPTTKYTKYTFQGWQQE